MSTEPEEFVIHFLAAATITVPFGLNGRGRLMEYGQELTVTEELRRLNTDRLGRCWLDLVDDEAGQVARFGKVVFARGPWPEGMSRLEWGSVAWEESYKAARAAALKIENQTERFDRLREIQEEYGPAPRTSRTIATFAGD